MRTGATRANSRTACPRVRGSRPRVDWARVTVVPPGPAKGTTADAEETHQVRCGMVRRRDDRESVAFRQLRSARLVDRTCYGAGRPAERAGGPAPPPGR